MTTHISQLYLRKQLNFIRGAGNFRLLLGTQTFLWGRGQGPGWGLSLSSGAFFGSGQSTKHRAQGHPASLPSWSHRRACTPYACKPYPPPKCLDTAPTPCEIPHGPTIAICGPATAVGLRQPLASAVLQAPFGGWDLIFERAGPRKGAGPCLAKQPASPHGGGRKGGSRGHVAAGVAVDGQISLRCWPFDDSRGPSDGSCWANDGICGRTDAAAVCAAADGGGGRGPGNGSWGAGRV